MKGKRGNSTPWQSIFVSCLGKKNFILTFTFLYDCGFGIMCCADNSIPKIEATWFSRDTLEQSMGEQFFFSPSSTESIWEEIEGKRRKRGRKYEVKGVLNYNDS